VFLKASPSLNRFYDTFLDPFSEQLANHKLILQFVVDGDWTTDHTAPQENDASGNLNNVLTIDRIVKHTPPTAGVMAGVTPTSTTTELAKDVPLEKKAPLEHIDSSDLPGAFPETPALEKGDFSVNPIPATSGTGNPVKLAPGEKVPDPSSFTSNEVTSGAHDDPELVAAANKPESKQTFSVSPLPAFAGAVNPVTTTPGERIPDSSTLTGNTINSAVRTDKESYENSGAFGHAPLLPPVVTPQTERDQTDTGVLGMPSVSKNMIPESSLPISAAAVGSFDATPTIQSAGPLTTTSQLAANVPLESSKVPEVVKESQEEAGVGPEASAIPEEVTEKSAVEKELLNKVPVAPSTSESTAGKGTDNPEKGEAGGETAAAVGGAAKAVGDAAAAYAYTAKDKAAEATGYSKSTGSTESSPAVASTAGHLPGSVQKQLPDSVQKSINSINASSASQSAAQGTPQVVKESIAESSQSPEAAAYEELVSEKKAVEKELLAEIKPENATGEPAPKITSTSNTSSLNAPASAPVADKPIDSRDVSPSTVPGSHTQNQTQPTVASGITATTTDETTAAPATPSKDTATAPATPPKSTTAKAGTPSSSKAADSPASSAAGSSAATDKKKKRTSFFGKLKAKFSEKNKD
jgi:hypothetical protein